MIYYIGAFMTYVAVPLPVWLDIALLGTAILLLCYKTARKPALFALAGLLAASLHLLALQQHSLPEQMAGKNLELQGRITGLVDRTPRRQRFNLDLEQALYQGQPVSIKRVRLSWYDSQQVLQPGQRVRVTARMKPVHGLANPYGFNYERWALQSGIDAQGKVESVSQILATDTSVSALRSRIADALAADFSAPVAASLQALLLGHGAALSEEQWSVLRHTGTVHLMVVSGLHIGLLVGLIWGGGRLCRPLLLRLNCPSGLIAPVLGAAALAGSGSYVLLAGMGIAAQRAWLMAAVFVLAYLFKLNLSVWQRWWLAMAVVLTAEPLAVFSAGFWLSFAAVAVILGLLTTGIHSVKGMVLRSQLGIFLCMAPVLLLSFGQLTWLSPVVNLVAIPLLSVLLVLSVPLWGLGHLGMPYAHFLLERAFELFWQALSYIAEIGWAVEPFAQFDGFNALLAAVAGFICMLPVSLGHRALALIIWGIALLPAAHLEGQERRFTAWVFDVGQGLAVLVEQGPRRLLFDTGPGFGDWNAYNWAIKPYLENNGVEQLDYLILSHGDQDHIGGFQALAKDLQVKTLLSGSAKPLADRAQPCRQGQEFSWPGVRFKFLAGSLGDNENARSCVLEISTGECRLLLTGDIDIATEHRLDINQRLRPVTWLLASHHGSRTGSSNRFLQLTRPDWVIFSAGYLNRYGHPHPAVVEATEKAGARWLNTATAGAVRLQADAQGCKTHSWRQLSRLRWQG